MAWATPPAKSSGETLTAAEINIISDDLLETAPAKFTTKGDLLAGTGANATTRVAVGADGTGLVASASNAGGVKWQTPWTCILGTGDNQSVNPSTLTALVFNEADEEIYDASTLHDISTNPSYITVGNKGIYLITAGANFAANTTGTTRYIAITVNGTEVAWSGTTATPANGVVRLDISLAYRLTAGQYVEVKAFHDASGAINVTAARFAVVYQHDFGL